MKKLEWLTYIVIICVAIEAIGIGVRWWYLQQVFPGDFVIYYNAAQGIFADGWLYKNFVAVVFKPLLLFDPFTAYMYWSGFQTVCFLILTHKLFEVKYGFIFIWFTIPFFRDLLQVGNIQITLALVAIYPLPSLLGILVKPHYFIFPLSHAIAARYRIWNESRNGTNKKFKSNINATDILHNKKSIRKK